MARLASVAAPVIPKRLRRQRRHRIRRHRLRRSTRDSKKIERASERRYRHPHPPYLTMDPDLDPTDHMPSRAALAREALLFRMRMLSKLVYEHEWVEDLEFEIWDMAHVVPARFGDKDVSREMAKYFRDLIKLGGGFWSWPEGVGQEGDTEVFVPLAEWKKVLAKRKP